MPSIDLVVSQGITKPLALFLNDGAGTFTRGIDVGLEFFVSPNVLELVDVDGDSDVDVVVVDDRGGKLVLLRGNGDGTFAESETIGPSGVKNIGAGRLTSGDVDLDGARRFPCHDADLTSRQNELRYSYSRMTGPAISRRNSFLRRLSR